VAEGTKAVQSWTQCVALNLKEIKGVALVAVARLQVIEGVYVFPEENFGIISPLIV
jgi:hypothetical protein